MKTSKFNLSNYHLTTCEMGRLVPIGLQEVLPGDIFSLKSSLLVRALPMLAPVMHPIHIRVHHFFVPNRVLWRFWGDFITSSRKGADLTNPTVTYKKADKGTLADYFGLPIDKDLDAVNAFPFLAYLLIYKEYFADDELQADLISTIDEYLTEVYEQRTAAMPQIDLGDGAKDVPNLPVFPVSWRKDYFTSARNEPQLGEEINIPIQGAVGQETQKVSLESMSANDNEPVFMYDSNVNKVGNLTQYGLSYDYEGAFYVDVGGAGFNQFTVYPSAKDPDAPSLRQGYAQPVSKFIFVPYDSRMSKTRLGKFQLRNVTYNQGGGGDFSTTGGTVFYFGKEGENVDSPSVKEAYKALTPAFQSKFSMYGKPIMTLKNLGEAAGEEMSLLVSDLRNSLALQRINEHRQMYGDRFVEYLNYLGVKSSDARLQRPQLLGTGRELLQISEVLQTADATGGVVGSMKGHGITSMSSNRFLRGFEEHGFICSFVSIVPQAIYSQGVSKFWNRSIPTDYWQKELNNLGMQPVFNKEVFYSDDNKNSEVFGYQNIWDEYRSGTSRISGDFRDILNDWHLARIFENRPALNADFIACNPSKRIFAEQTTNPFLLMIKNRCVARRLLPKRTSPKTF